LVSGTASAHNIPKNKWWGTKDVRSFFRIAPLIKFRRHYYMIRSHTCTGVGPGYLEKGYGRVWNHFDCVLHVDPAGFGDSTVLAARLHVIPGGTAIWLGVAETG
jgi:hypothetical protein